MNGEVGPMFFVSVALWSFGRLIVFVLGSSGRASAPAPFDDPSSLVISKLHLFPCKPKQVHELAQDLTCHASSS